MKNTILSLLVLSLSLLATECVAESEFKEPQTEAEWKAFCNAPDYLERVKQIKDKQQRERVSGTCLRAPWQKFTPSAPKYW